jgi:trehalose 6-phosphate phosphatase
MTPVLSPAGALIIDDIARERTFLAFDFDGTLAPIVADRFAAQLRSETRALLRTVSLLYPCAVISGRERADVAARVAGVPLVAVIGNHGAEAGRGPLDRRARDVTAAWRRRLESALAGVDGLEIEDKQFSIAVHYRRAPSWDEAARKVRDAVAELEGAATFGGIAVVNVVPHGAPTKGDAIRAICERVGARMAVYIGDDQTDEEAFRAEVVRISVRVGDSTSSAARFYVPDQLAVDDLLRALVAARARQDGLGDRWQGLVRAMAP